MRREHQPTPTDLLSASIDALSAEVRVLRDVLDEIRDALQWRNKNRTESPATAASPELAAALLPALPIDHAPTDQRQNVEAEPAVGARTVFAAYTPEGHALELRRDQSGYRHYYLAGRCLSPGDLFEIWLPETGWTPGRFEHPERKWRQPWVYFDDHRPSIPVTAEHCLRWPEQLSSADEPASAVESWPGPEFTSAIEATPAGHALELRFEPSGYRHYLAGQPLHAGEHVEMFVPGAGWTLGRYEWNYQPDRPAWICFDDERAVAVTDEQRLRWPET